MSNGDQMCHVCGNLQQNCCCSNTLSHFFESRGFPRIVSSPDPNNWPTPKELKPHKCPVCEGSGKNLCQLSDGYKPDKLLECHGCNGKGWVTV